MSYVAASAWERKMVQQDTWSHDSRLVKARLRAWRHALGPINHCPYQMGEPCYDLPSGTRANTTPTQISHWHADTLVGCSRLGPAPMMIGMLLQQSGPLGLPADPFQSHPAFILPASVWHLRWRKAVGIHFSTLISACALSGRVRFGTQFRFRLARRHGCTSC